MQNFVGNQIDRYHILEQLGIGGMAVVYKAYDTRLEREVAVKVIRTEAIPPEQYARLQKRFEREAKAMAGFSHPNIVPVYDYGEVNGSPFLVMQYIAGGTLKDRITKPIPYAQALSWLTPIADALSYAHQQEVVHRDVKPSNILFDKSSTRPILTDFGIAKILENTESSLTSTGLGVGTPEYMAPEQWQGEATKASDQYALGVVLYELLTGQKPYTAETPVAIALKQMSEPLRRPGEFVSGIPASVERLLFKTLARNPLDRYESMPALHKALLAILRELDAAAPTPLPIHIADEGETVDAFGVKPTPGLKNRSSVHASATKDAPRKKVPVWALWFGLGLFVVILVVFGILLALLRKDVQPSPSPTTNITGKEILTSQAAPIIQPSAIFTLLPIATQTEFPTQPPLPSLTQAATQTSSVFITPTPILYQPLSNCVASHLRIGDSAFVSYDGGKNKIRSEPDTSPSDNIIAEIQPGEVVRIVGGPECNYGWILWEVETTRQETGWTPESDGQEFWLMLLTTRKICDGALPTRLLEGKKAKVNEEPPDSNLLRTGPSRFDTVIDRIKPGKWMMVLEGPICGEKTNWWKVENLETGIVGWTMEGNLDTYYLSPLP